MAGYSLRGFIDTRRGDDSDYFSYWFKIGVCSRGFLANVLNGLGVGWAANIEMGGVSTSFAGSVGRKGAVGKSMVRVFAVVAVIDQWSFVGVVWAVSGDVARLIAVVTIRGW